MDMLLARNAFRPDGIFSGLQPDPSVVASTTFPGFPAQATSIMHAYQRPDGKWDSKLQPGEYVCQRGVWRLRNAIEDIETFEILGVVDWAGGRHTDVLFHPGNFDESSEGCVCPGFKIITNPLKKDGSLMVTDSLNAFRAFMKLQQGLDQFRLRVTGSP